MNNREKIHSMELYISNDKDIPPNVLAVGNPCRVLREINEYDKEFYFKDKKIDFSLLKPLNCD